MFGVKSKYKSSRFLRKDSGDESDREPGAIRKLLSDTKEKIKKSLQGEVPYVTPFKYCEVEETNIRKLTGVRRSGGDPQEPSAIDVIHEKESRLMHGVMLSCHSLSEPYDETCDRPFIRGDPESDSEAEYEREQARKKKEYEREQTRKKKAALKALKAKIAACKNTKAP